MFESVLIANRGEISVRISRTLRSMGVRSIAVYSDADAGNRHCRAADAAYRIGPAAAAKSYLRVQSIIDAALASGAQALHPGYGFLAENVELAQACAAAGIVFIGPPPTAIEAMGDKIRAKATVAARGVRVVPDVDGTGLSDADLAERAALLGLPVLIKPAAGGGGKGMRLVRDASMLIEEIAAARREAIGAFGNDTLLIERFMERPRHLEVQVLADSFGNIVHLGERECSLQRRHQKVIEEAPSRFLSAQGREQLCEQAVAAAQSCGYINAGTVEFIMSGDDPDTAYFMEMNTRLQVEHPVTEMVWGLDLVELQIRIAAGQPLPFSQSDLRPVGHAIEARVYAEDPHREFFPTGGLVVGLHEPTDLRGVRVDSGLATGMEIGSNYDPMLAKVISWGADREASLNRLRAALNSTVILGVTTNVAFLADLLDDPDVHAGVLDTDLVGRVLARLPVPVVPPSVVVAAALVWAVPPVRTPVASAPAWSDRSGWRIGEPARQTWLAAGERGEAFQVALTSTGPPGSFMASVGEQVIEASIHWVDAVAVVRYNDEETRYHVARTGATTWLGGCGSTWVFADVPLVRPGATRSALSGATNVVSPMPGAVIAVFVAVGARVEARQPIAVVEAMKMEHTLRAEVAGVVAELRVHVGDVVALNQVIAVVSADLGAATGSAAVADLRHRA